VNLDDLKLIPLSEVPAILTTIDGIERTRQTVHNWATKGIKRGRSEPLILKTQMRASQLYTTRKWVLEFINAAA